MAFVSNEKSRLKMYEINEINHASRAPKPKVFFWKDERQPRGCPHLKADTLLLVKANLLPLGTTLLEYYLGPSTYFLEKGM